MAREGGSEAGRKAAKEGKTGTSELVSTIKVKKKCDSSRWIIHIYAHTCLHICKTKQNKKPN